MQTSELVPGGMFGVESDIEVQNEEKWPPEAKHNEKLKFENLKNKSSFSRVVHVNPFAGLYSEAVKELWV